jgi:hypothetical protein
MPGQARSKDLRRCCLALLIPILALKEWQKKRPKLFVKRVYDQTELDS